MLSKLAQNIGIAQNDNDFKGMYEYHQMHHGEESLTLTNQGAVDRLNQQMKDLGYRTHFQKGDRISMNFDQNGNIISAHATGERAGRWTISPR